MRSTYILRVRVRAYYIYETTAKFKSANIFISAARDQTTKFKDRQYFRLYGNCPATTAQKTVYMTTNHPSFTKQGYE